MAFDPARQDLDDFTATNQYRIQGVKQCREDTVLLVNGIPLVVAEYKSYLSSGKDWKEAVHQLHRYQRQAPLILAPNVFCVAADEDEFRYGAVLFDDEATKEQIESHLDWWGRWLGRYPEEKGWWNEAAADAVGRPFGRGCQGVPSPQTLPSARLSPAFCSVRDEMGRTTKKIARYQQFEAVNDIVDRTVSQARNARSACKIEPDSFGTREDPASR